MQCIHLIFSGVSRCEDWCRLPIITPCRHLLCLGCVSLDSEKCTFPGCQNHYEMQSPEILTRPENPNPKWPVPKDLIELQPSYKQVRTLESDVIGIGIVSFSVVLFI